VRWVRGEAARDDVLVERGVVFFKIIDAGRFEHSLDFAQAAAPVRDVVQKSEAENRIRMRLRKGSASASATQKPR